MSYLLGAVIWGFGAGIWLSDAIDGRRWAILIITFNIAASALFFYLGWVEIGRPGW